MQDYVNNIYFRLLSLFTDVFYFFAVDLGGLQPIIYQITAWLNKGKPSTLHESIRLRLVIVIEANGS
jgi:hypothetical protein